MVRITWLGEDTENEAGPSFNTWNGIKFPKDVPVEVNHPEMIAAARTNRFYRIEEAEHGQAQGQGEAKAQGEERHEAPNKSGYSHRSRKKKTVIAQSAGTATGGDATELK